MLPHRLVIANVFVIDFHYPGHLQSPNDSFCKYSVHVYLIPEPTMGCGASKELQVANTIAPVVKVSSLTFPST